MAMTLNSEEQKRVNNVYNEREKALAENNDLYTGLIDNAGEMRDAQNRYLAEQEAFQNKQVDVNLERQKQLIDKQKEEAQKTKDAESRKALNTYLAFTNPYSSRQTDNLNRGLANSGVSATERMGAMTSYNDRMARANTALNDAITEYNLKYDQAVQDGDLQKAQNALNKLQLEIQNSQDYFNNVSTLKQQSFSNAQTIRNAYMDQYNNVYSQILKEQAQAEAARQWQAEYNLSKQKFNYEKQQNNLNGGLDGNSTLYGAKSKYSDIKKAIETDKKYNGNYSNDVAANYINQQFEAGNLSPNDVKKLLQEFNLR